ncbi:sialidase-3-like [Channa argus]|uniref:sialidase-3-like n=1 Tax=Channa argus TaxID=215402 RepID=UPI0035223512
MANKPSDPELKTIFESNEKEGRVYRIPALFYHREKKILLAFAEKRKTKDDAHTFALVMKRGKENKEKVWEFEEPERELVKKADHGDRPMNPCPVFEKNSKSLLLFFIFVEGDVSEKKQIKNYDNKARLCYIESTDAGNSWSEVNYLSEKQKEIETESKTWATFAVGPGHGLQAHDGTLIVPVHGYYSSCCCRSWCCYFTYQYAFSLYSKDQGKIWKFGKMLQTNSGECQMAEFFDDGDKSVIYCNARTVGSYRVEAVSQDGGNEFKPLVSADKLVETCTGCQGSVVSFPPPDEGQDQKPKWLLYSHPTDTCRKDLGVYLNESPHDSTTWSKPWIINRGPSGYSDLVYMDDGWFACLMECGEKSEIEQIAVKVFSYHEVKQGIEKEEVTSCCP